MWNIPGSLREIPEDWDVSASGASQGINDMTTPGMEMIESGYAGPCPPMGENHRYIFHLYALEEAFIEDGLPTAVGGDANNIVTVAEFEAARTRVDRAFTVLGDTALGGWYPGVAGPVCGNGLVEADEECEEDVALGNTCTTVPGGFTGGTLRCNIAACQFDTSDCVIEILPGSVEEGGTCTGDVQCMEGLSCVVGKCREIIDILERIQSILENDELNRRQMIVYIARELKDFFDFESGGIAVP